MHEPLRNIRYFGKKLFFVFWVLIFACPKAVADVKTACIRAGKHSILGILQGSEYTSVICFALFGKIEISDKIDSLAM